MSKVSFVPSHPGSDFVGPKATPSREKKRGSAWLMSSEQIYYTPDEVIGQLRGRFTKKTLANWRSQKIGPKHVRFGGRILYNIAVFEAWQQREAEDPTPRSKRAGLIGGASPDENRGPKAAGDGSIDMIALPGGTLGLPAHDAAEAVPESGAVTAGQGDPPADRSVDDETSEVSASGQGLIPIKHRSRLYRGYDRRSPLIIWSETGWRHVKKGQRPADWGEVISEPEARRLFPLSAEAPLPTDVFATRDRDEEQAVEGGIPFGPNGDRDPREVVMALELLESIMPDKVRAALEWARVKRLSLAEADSA